MLRRNYKSDCRRLCDEFEKNGSGACKEALDETLAEYGNDEEAKIFLRVMLEPELNRYPGEMRDSLVHLDFVENPKSFSEWLSDEYFSGDLKYELWPSWQQELSHVCTVSNRVTEWYVTGCIGGGKTFASLVAQLYRGPYICSCLRCPQLYFGIAKDSEIVFGLFNALKDNAARVDFSQLARFVRASRWFSTKCPAIITQSDCIIQWPSKNLMLKIGSNEMHALGANLFSYLIDEVNFMRTPECREANEHQAYKIYHHTVRRMKSRFQQYGICPGLACVVSSRASASSFLEDLMRKNKDVPGTYVTDYSQWEAKPRKTFSEHIFRVAVGNKYRKSEVLDTVITGGSPDTKLWRVDPTIAKESPPGQNMIYVPVDFYHDFLRDIDGSLRDIAGVPTLAVSPLIQRTESVWECIDPKRKHPFMKEEHTLSLDDSEASLINFMNWRELGKIVMGVWQPLHFPGLPRFAHVDLGLTGDCAAFAVGCCYDSYILTKTDLITGQPTEDFMPKVWVDFMLRIRPVHGEQIDLGKITTFLINLRNYGFWLQRVTFDGFASHMAIQTILKANILPTRTTMKKKAGDELVKTDSYVVSVDRDDKPYTNLRDMLFQGAVSFYHYQPFIDEVLALEHSVKKTDGGVIKGKVDHSPKGSKDISDAVAGMCWGITTSRAFTPATPVKEGVGDLPDKNIERQLADDLMSGVVGTHDAKIRALIPPPQSTPPARSYRGRKIVTKKDWMQDVGFNRHKP